MSSKRPAPAKTAKALSQVEGVSKDRFIRAVLGDIPDLDEEVAKRIAEHFSDAVALIRADRALVERYLTSKAETPPRSKPFDPHAFSLMKVFRTAGERGLREKLRDILESSHLQALANAQKISLPIRLRAEGADVAGLKEAIVSGVKRRHEDWQAAS
jgi:hypothetical protein